MQMNLKWFRRAFFLTVILFIAGCSSNQEFSKDYGDATMATDDMAMEAEEIGIRAGFGSSPSEMVVAQSYNASQRMMIYNANLSLEVKDYHEVEAIIQERASTLGGYIVESSINSSGEERINGNLVVKVPQKSFHSFINEVESNSVKVQDRRVHGNDVTEEYIDLESRLKSKRVVEERLLGFMQKAEKTEDLLKISNDLSRVQEEIEQLLGRINYLETNVNFSTVTIHMFERLVSVPSIQDQQTLDTWLKAKSLFMDSVNGLISFFSSVMIFLVGRSPIIVPLAIMASVVVYFVRKKGNETPPYEG